MTDLRGKTVLITGAGGGFGVHMTRQFRSAGCKLMLTDISDGALYPAVAESGDAMIISIAADLSTIEGCEDLFDACANQQLAPDVLVNNAGIGVSGRLDHVPDERWEALMQLNLLAPMRLSKLFLPAMIERGSGHIANISSLAGLVGASGLSSYCASKFGLRGFGESLAADLKDTGVQVTIAYPCFSRTPILDSEQFGHEPRLSVPEQLISEPADVVKQIIKGIRRNSIHVYPDKHARRIHLINRLVPWVMPILNRRLQDQAAVASKGNP